MLGAEARAQLAVHVRDFEHSAKQWRPRESNPRRAARMAGEVKTDNSEREGKYEIALRVVLVIGAGD
ncbi:hypothetical protein [Corallococcus sp. CA053C]|uniref:hypothetical protein n=1 Tax=Corallococcus sp. CA053C TaxID=2316732 RepID=UPI0011C42477|nr:hypothetical protein [Corallococcus sp. CA053C]